jgi:DNA-binding response OmpR family regulator
MLVELRSPLVSLTVTEFRLLHCLMSQAGTVLPTGSLLMQVWAYNQDMLIDFLTDLHQIEQPRSVVLLWDGLPAHRGRRMLE